MSWARSTRRATDANPNCHQLLKDATIFKDPATQGFVAPLKPEPVLPAVGSLWPPFYPIKGITPGDKIITNLVTQYAVLFNELPLVASHPQEALMFNYIDSINQMHYETKELIYSKSSMPMKGNAYWTGTYCPLSDKGLTNKELGSGQYGIAYSVTGPMTKCCGKPIKFVVKSIKKSDIDMKQLNDIQLADVASVSQIISPSGTKLTDIFATEVGSLHLY